MFRAASAGSDVELQNLLDKHGCGPNVQQRSTLDSLLHVAIRHNNQSVASCLLRDARLSLRTANSAGHTCLHEAAVAGNTRDLPTIMARSAGDVHEALSSLGLAPIHCAVQQGHASFVSQYLQLVRKWVRF